MTGFGEVAPLALMSGSIELVRAWVVETLGALADNDEHNARLRDTLRVFLQENGSYKTSAERLMLHKNTVQYRVRKAEEGLKRPISQDRLHIELALLASQWLGSAVLRPVAEPATRLARPEAQPRPEVPTRSPQGYASSRRHQPARRRPAATDGSLWI